MIGRPVRPDWVKGYSDAQLADIQVRYGLNFPPDLVALYRERRPIDAYDWLHDNEAIKEMINRPFEGLWFDVEHAGLWWPEWGERPSNSQDRKALLRSVVDDAPRLIPLLSHRYIPEEPHESGNPVFSVVQSDIIYYGANLLDYFERELSGFTDRPWPHAIKRIRFWSDMVERNGKFIALPRPKRG
jgi:hypothetical protein